MNSLTTNIIRNVYNIGTNSCDAGPQYCADGYALYFPCLKDITKGQDVCFDFYVADYAGKNEYDIAAAAALDDSSMPDSGKELADLRDVDAITLNLIGQFNCTYGSFSYPDNISSLQTEKYPVVYREDFGTRTLCHLSLLMVDTESTDSEIIYSQESDFYSGTEVEVAAYDTPTHIFLGWATMNLDGDDCPDDTWFDTLVSTANTYKFIIKEDTILFALYRPRKTYTIVSDPDNMSSLFTVNHTQNHIQSTYHISNRDKDGFDDSYKESPDYQYDYLDILEGYHVVIKCIPSTDRYDSESDPDNDMMFVFDHWIDGDTNRCRLFTIGKDTTAFEEGYMIKLKAVCTGPVPYEEIDDDKIDYDDNFDEEGIHILTEFSDIDIYDYYPDGIISLDANEVYQKFINEIGYLYFNNGYIVLSSAGIEDGIKVNIYAKADEYCEMTVKINEYEATTTISTDEFKLYEFYFRKCNKSNIEISVNGECLVDLVEVCKEEIIDKGKAQLCLPGEVTENLPSGPLSVNGAIMVNGHSYGLSTTQIGNINRLPKITLNI